MELLTTNNVWMMVCTFLVFFMHLGFTFLEIGLTRQKNSINILFKNFFVITAGLILYCAIGFNLMYPSEWIIEGVLGLPSPGLDSVGAADLGYNEGYTYWTDFLFQGMFAATAATIISGAVAERIKISSFMLIAILYVSIVYPIVGAWKWGGGFMDALGFYDFAGSTLVHAVGGWGALVVIYFLGARKGRFGKGGGAIPGSNIPLSAAGVMILWLGWFGFNGGSELIVSDEASAIAVSQVFLNTNMAAAGGVVAALFTSLFLTGKMDVTMAINGAIAGLVAITAGPSAPSGGAAVLIGAVGGVIVYFSILFLDKTLKIDDPVGAISAHGIVGIFGVMVVPLTSDASFGMQFVGVVAIGGFTYVASLITIFVINMVMPIRATDEEQDMGLDASEIGVESYPEFK